MTDEEMAEEYYYKIYPVTLNIGEEERKKKVTDIFLAGLKAGKTELQNNVCEELEKENAELKSECRTCVYTDSPCIRSDYPSINGVCDHYKNVFDENIELKDELTYAETHCIFSSDCPTQKENAELKLKLEAFEGQTPWKDIKDKSEVIGKLTKATEIIREFVEWANWQGSNCPSFKSIQDRAEQFLKEE